MKREILFRGKVSGKRLNKGEWIEGDLVHQLDYYVKPCDKHFILNKYDTNDYEVGEPIQVDPATVGQFTGLTDLNGVKIFEGDVVICTFCIIEDWESTEEITVDMSDFSTISALHQAEYLEVIGNIHETQGCCVREEE